MPKNIADDIKIKSAQRQSELPWEKVQRNGQSEHDNKSRQAARTTDPAARTKYEAEADLAAARAAYAEKKLRQLRLTIPS